MMEPFDGLVFDINYVGSSILILDGSEESKILIYFTKEIDSAEVPLALTIGQAEQLYNDLSKIFVKQSE